MNFKEQLKEDIQQFINIDEFAEDVVIDNEKYKAVVTHPIKEDTKNEYEGIFNALDLKIYLPYEKKFRKYTTGKQITVNDDYYIIDRAFNEEGIFTLELKKRERF